MYHDDDYRGECFRAYKNPYDSYIDHSLFLKNSSRYSRLFTLKKTDYKGWAKGLKSCGYATSPTYASRLIDIIELYNLHEYDTSKSKGYNPPAFEGPSQSASVHEVFEFNSNFYVLARKGDTFRSIADDLGMSYKALAKFNERDKNDTLEEGEYVWLKKKRRAAPKEYVGYVYKVAAGESMYSISQRFGIRLKYLYKMNDLEPDYRIKVGDMLRIR